MRAHPDRRTIDPARLVPADLRKSFVQAGFARLESLHLAPGSTVGQRFDLGESDVAAATHEVDQGVNAKVRVSVDDYEGDVGVAVAAGIAVAVGADAALYESDVHRLDPWCLLDPRWWLIDSLVDEMDTTRGHSLHMDYVGGSGGLRRRLTWGRGRDPVVWRQSIDSDNVGTSIFT